MRPNAQAAEAKRAAKAASDRKALAQSRIEVATVLNDYVRLLEQYHQVYDERDDYAAKWLTLGDRYDALEAELSNARASAAANWNEMIKAKGGR